MNGQQTSLVHGCNAISKRQRSVLLVTGYLYQFEPNPPYRPRALPILVILANCLPVLLMYLNDELAVHLIKHSKMEETPQYQAIVGSTFVYYLGYWFLKYRMLIMVINILIILTQHGSIANTIASCNKYVSEHELTTFARHTFMIFFLKALACTLAYFVALSQYYFRSDVPIFWNFKALLSLYLIFVIKMVQDSPLVYICYLGQALGRHVENFSALYIDTMFDQFMKAIEKEDRDELYDQADSLPFFDTHSMTSSEMARAQDYQGCYGYICSVKHHTIGGLLSVYNFLRSFIVRLSVRKYPELPEMKMTKLSSTQCIQISETARTANNHLIRVRLRRTQMMLCELRDLVSDINKTSSPILFMYMLYDTVLIILITNISIQAKVYKSFTILILPTVLINVGMVAMVLHMCTSLDNTRKQLKLLINKLFDFIIMNQRVVTNGKRAKAQIHATDSEVCPLSGSEANGINETWSQFQYTRKMATTIRFTMSGIVPVTRRLVLSTFGHVLSFSFISIEIMSIIDTLNTPREAIVHQGEPALGNSTQSHGLGPRETAHHWSSSQNSM